MTIQKLSVNETMFHRMNIELRGHNTISTVIKVKGEVNQKIFVTALKMLFDRHPRLRATIAEHSNEYCMTLGNDFTNIPILFVEEEDENRGLDFYTESFCYVDTKKYVWKATCFKVKNKSCCYLILTFSHAMIDGLSAYSIIKELIGFLNRNGSGVNEEISHLPLIVLNTPAKDKDTRLSNQETSSFRWPYQTEDISIEQRSTGNVLVTVDANKLTSIRPFLKEKQLSIHDLLNGALLMTIQKYKPKELKTVLLHTPISLRVFVQPKISNDHVLCATRLINTYHNLTNQNQNIIHYATDYRKQLSSKIRQFNQNQEDEIDTYEKVNHYIAKCKEPRDAFFMGFGISNLGALNFGDQNSTFKVESFHFAGSRAAADLVMLINASILLDKLQLNFNFTKPFLDENWVNHFAQDFIKEIDNCN